MLYSPKKYDRIITDINDELLKLDGELDDDIAKITFAKFLRYNLGLAVDLVSGFKMTAHQEMALKAFFLRNYNLCVWARGASKSTIAALACFFIPIFEPNTNIVIAGPTFRTARNIFAYMEKIEKSPEAVLLKQCLGIKSKRADLFEWEINGGLIRAIPLNGEKIRGLRANVLILDEFLLLSQDIVETVLMPFLIAPSDIKERKIITDREDEQVKKGELRPEDRTVFPNTSRMICLSSASYTFEYLYQVYKEWENKIYSPIKDNATYFISQISYEALPPYMVEDVIIEQARGSEELHPSFKREYCAQFVDGSDSYFSARKMLELTVKDGERPTTKIRGDKDKEYVLAIDPNFSQSASADHFAMCVLEINKEEQKAIVVHNYAMAGVELNKHIEYFYYLMTNFNIVLIIADNADGNFIQSANQSSLFVKNNLKIEFIDYDGELVGDEYAQMLKNVRNQYNLNGKRICFKHVFNQTSIRRINEQLQTWINKNKIYFASKLTQVNGDYEKSLSYDIPLEFEKGESIADLIAAQDDLIPLLKKECALIEIRVSPTGGQVFDMPIQLRRNESANRVRRDSYTALLLGIEGVQAYINLMTQPPKEKQRMAVPQLFGRSTL